MSAGPSAEDLRFMSRALELARAQLGRTSPNPSVGCVIVANGAIVGEGATGNGGRPHAEEIALAQAGEGAEGATAYVTLEPCHQRSGGSFSCSQLLLGAGATRVLIQRVNRLSSVPTASTGMQTRRRLTPQARSAIISLSADIRPKTSNTAVRKPHGTVKVSENGRT